jgi:hypothetical protein
MRSSGECCAKAASSTAPATAPGPACHVSALPTSPRPYPKLRCDDAGGG